MYKVMIIMMMKVIPKPVKNIIEKNVGVEVAGEKFLGSIEAINTVLR